MSLDDRTRAHAVALIENTRDLPPGVQRKGGITELEKLFPGSDIANLLLSDYPAEDIYEMVNRPPIPIEPLSKPQLLSLVQKIMSGEVASDAELNGLVEQFNLLCKHPAGSDLIYYPDDVFGTGIDPTPEQIVEMAMRSDEN